MQSLRYALVVAAVLASTWAAGAITDRWLPVQPVVLAENEAPPARGPAPDPEPVEKDQPAPDIQEVSDEEIKKELERAQKALGGAGGGGGEEEQKGPGEYRASRPLPADFPIDLPSDF